MHRTTIMLPRELKMRAERLARKKGISLGELLRESLEARVSRPGEGEERDLFFADQNVFRGKSPKDLSRNHDRYLYGDGE